MLNSSILYNCLQLNFAKVIGSHKYGTGLQEVWEENEVYGSNTASNIMQGKQWNRIKLSHKRSYEALWRILWPKFVEWAEHESTDINITDTVNNGIESFENVSHKLMPYTVQDLVTVWNKKQDYIKQFEKLNQSNPTFCLWRKYWYMEFVEILLRWGIETHIYDTGSSQ